MLKLKEYLKILFYPLLLIVVEFSLIFIFTLIFNLNTNFEVGTNIYQQNLNLFLSNYKLLVAFLSFIILIPFLIKKVEPNKEKLSKNIIIFYILMGIVISLTYNLLLCGLNKVNYFTNLYDNVNRNIMVSLIATGILGPILEELIFRGIVYKKLKKINTSSLAIIITGLIFGLFHGNLIQFIYAFLFNFILVKSYERENNILIPIIIHVSANSINVVLISFIINLNLLFTFIFFIVFVILLVLLLKSLYNDKKDFLK